MSLATYQNIEAHFDAIDCSIFNGELLMDSEAVAEMKAYLARWNKAIDNMIYIDVEDVKPTKANCDYSVYNKIDGTTTYKRFKQALPMFNSSPKQMQDSAEYMIAGWNYQSPNLVYTLERTWWNGER
jgi:hypothetical protein